MTTMWIAIGALVVSALTLLANLYNVVRGQQWRNSDDGKAVNVKIARLTQKITIIETTLKSIPTTADMARVTAGIEHAQNGINRLQAGQTRIENFLLEHKE